ncbi:MAG: hypothetical protein KGD57_00240 [Candidatus Lokiarchaeota archaeon]|nr:hypothetical protein [Candidatus Lokiarchaeota archaeon]
MNNIFRIFKKLDIDNLKKLIHRFYQEKPNLYNFENMNIGKTFEIYQNYSDLGIIWVFILINYTSLLNFD